MERETGDKVVDYGLRVYNPADGVNTSYDYTHWNDKGKLTETQEVDTNKRLRMYHYYLDNRYTKHLPCPPARAPTCQTALHTDTYDCYALRRIIHFCDIRIGHAKLPVCKMFTILL